MQDFEVLYNEFMKSYSSNSVEGKDAGELVAKLSGYYPNYNLEVIRTERKYSLVLKNEISKVEDSGKQVSASKAEIIAEASDEALDFKTARANIVNLEMLIQGAKSLQRGLQKEMGFVSHI